MFVEDQSQKVIFNMKYYTIKQDENLIKIYTAGGRCLGIAAEYKESSAAKAVIDETKELLKYCFRNKITCLFTFPDSDTIEKVTSNGQKA